MPTPTDEVAIPESLSKLLSKARAQLKEKQSADVKLTMVEVRAIYSLSHQLYKAREARDTFRKQNQSLRKDLEKLGREARDQDLIRNRSIVALLIEVDRILTGEETSPQAAIDAHARLQTHIQRARESDRKRTARRRERPVIEPPDCEDP